MNMDFLEALDALERERHMPKEKLIEAIESALVSAYKKNYGDNYRKIRVNIDNSTGDINVFMGKDVVEEVEDNYSQISLEEAREVDPEYEIGDIIEYQVTPSDFGRVAAQTAKQVVVQRIREAERDMIYDDYHDREGQVVTGVVQRVSGGTVFINIGRAEAILSANEQIPGETFRVNDRVKAFIMDVRSGRDNRDSGREMRRSHKGGPQIFLSRTHPHLVNRLFELEVPELQDHTIEIKNVSREPGSRSKISVCTYDENVDPVGACVGPRGTRVQAVVDELGGEKIDIIPWSEEPGRLISSALSPAKVEMVLIDESDKSATVVVPDYQLSLAIGKEGQNVRLAARLCGWKIDIKSHSQYFPEGTPMPETGETVIETVTHLEDVMQADETTVAFKASSLKSMRKAELIAYAQEHGIEMDLTATNAVMIETITRAMEER
ncbi:MAG: transcription termination/antitermination protein NusA [Firmicutes bacterium]|nr:transcription termination/antitermination protein NusA [Bacillota bacterium]